MMEKCALAGEGGGCTPTPFHSITITYKVAVYSPAERADTLHVFHIYPYMLCGIYCMKMDLEKISSKEPKFYFAL
jgi:hypothetical protein